MKKFKFNLQTVHDVREMREENEQLELARLQNDVEKAVAEIERIEMLKAQALENYSARLNTGKPMNAFELELNSNHISNLDRLKRDAVAVLESRKAACAVQTAKVAKAMQAVKITGKLRENQALKHKGEADRSEQTAVDELVSANYARQITQ
ncbi:MAG: flagellar FliJ family protein [Pyrinomonadaceae bacterium]|nr:flagellar FliJ family protein [Pyrinomonadaceae bacterium]